ncbi:MAG: TetR/AcrR family transcriptional regulator [Polyangiaceae bacterium]|nr:TetR/AcrR family transcriptional regulator [Myxococcales bacterium]MCB9588401.1 TetR/AcrR family transcriptional regulator [Polyangiaceae bacterium]
MSPTSDRVPTRIRILDVAEQEFAIRGYRAASLSDIADGVGIRTPSLYKHFASKQALYEAVLDRLMLPFAETLKELINPPRSEEDAQTNVVTMFRMYVKHPNYPRILEHATLAGGEELESVIARMAPLLNFSVENSPRHDSLAANMVMAFHYMLGGYVIAAPLLKGWTGRDPFSEEAMATQEELLKLLSRVAWQTVGVPTE